MIDQVEEAIVLTCTTKDLRGFGIIEIHHWRGKQGGSGC